MRVIAIDPGSETSSWIVVDTESLAVLSHDEAANRDLAYSLHYYTEKFSGACHLAIEYMRPRGMKTSQQEMDTQFWAGRLVQSWVLTYGDTWTPIARSQEKMTICGSPRANDANIRQACIDRYGGKEKAIGGKKCKHCHGKGTLRYRRKAGYDGQITCAECKGTGWSFPPGPLYGIKSHLWQALAVALTFLEMRKEKGKDGFAI